eukprot:scaffold98043_cov75-Phaeocystis_antarctica.AAC.1
MTADNVQNDFFAVAAHKSETRWMEPFACAVRVAVSAPHSEQKPKRKIHSSWDSAIEHQPRHELLHRDDGGGCSGAGRR